MSRKIARITQEKKLLLANEVVESNAKTSLNSDGRLDTDEIIEYPAELEGGRNLVIDSNYLPMNGSDSGNHNLTLVKQNENGEDYFSAIPINNGNIYYNNGITFSNPRYEGEIYTLSFDIMTTQDSNWGFYFYTNRSGSLVVKNIPSTNGKWERFTYTFTQESTKDDNILFGFHQLVAGEEIGWRKLKLEKGSQATPWTPAPEDLELNYPDSIQNFNSSISGNNIIAPEFIEGYPFVKPVIDDSLILWLDGSTGNNYEQTGTWKDLSGNGNHGQLMNFGYIEDSGWVDGGLRFDGVNDYVNILHNNSLNLINEGTISLFINHTANTSTYETIIAKRISNNCNYEIFLKNNDKSLGFYSGGSIITIPYIPPLNTWIYITVVINASGSKFYIDGLYKNSTTITFGSINNAPLTIGTYANEWFCGGIKNIRIYNRALTDEEILQNYQAGQCSPLLAMRGDV